MIAKFLMPEAGDFVELILLCQCTDRRKNHLVSESTELHLIAYRAVARLIYLHVFFK
jgi:hypothetical protein